MLLIYVTKSSPRLQYIASFIFKELLKTAYAITADATNFKSFEGLKLNYSNTPIADDEIIIPNKGLLWESGIKEQTLNFIDANGNIAFFGSDESNPSKNLYPFDIFSAAFYLISRYEEYLTHEKDKYGRFFHKSSIAWRENFLHIPLVNVWINDLAEFIHARHRAWDYSIPSFKFTPTYDIDMAWSYLHKGFARNAGGTVRSILTLNLGKFFEQFRVLTGAADPADIYGWLNTMHKKFSLDPIYFFLVAEKNSEYDKNILPSVKAMQKLIRETSALYSVGLHPSWHSSNDTSLLLREKTVLEDISGKSIDTSRQHYLRFTLPVTYRNLIAAGILHDHSMGYGTSNGFRASSASSFFWYDLENEQQTKLRIHPFCYMDSNAYYDKKINPEQAINEIKYFYEVCRENHGHFIAIFHNHLLASKYWPEVYEEFLGEVGLTN